MSTFRAIHSRFVSIMEMTLTMMMMQQMTMRLRLMNTQFQVSEPVPSLSCQGWHDCLFSTQ